MELIIGGAYSGKLTYAKKEYGIGEKEVLDLALCGPDGTSRAFRHLEAYTKRCAEKRMTADEVLLTLEPHSGTPIFIISREIGSGIVPMDKAERYWRELHGQILAALAKKADRVTRLFCGVEEVLK